jgi:hypothetical protein
MELVISALEDKINYLEQTMEELSDIPEVKEHIKDTIRAFNQVIDIVQLYIDLKENK